MNLLFVGNQIHDITAITCYKNLTITASPTCISVHDRAQLQYSLPCQSLQSLMMLGPFLCGLGSQTIYLWDLHQKSNLKFQIESNLNRFNIGIFHS